MKKLLSAILLMLFSIHVYAKPLYVRLESDGDLIFSNTPILDTHKSETTPKNKTRIAEVTKESINQTQSSKINTKPMPVEVAKENAKNKFDSKVISISLPNNIPIIAAVTEEKIHTSQPSKKTSALLKNTPMITETTKENVNNKHDSKIIPISLPNIIPIIAATEESLHVTQKSGLNTKPTTPHENKSLIAEITEEKNNLLKPNSEKKAIIRPKNKSVIVEITEENLNKAHPVDKTKVITLPKNKPIVAKITKETINNTHKLNAKTKLATLPKNKVTITKITKETINNTHKPNAKTKLATLPKNKVTTAKVTKETINNTHKLNAKTKLATLPKNKPVIAKIKKENINKKSPSNSINTELTYKTFRITSPLNKEVIQNLPSILVDLKVEPKLQRDHQIQLFIDGKRMSKPSNSTHINTDIAKKGLHEIYGLIIDKNKNFIIQSNVITVYIREADMKTSHAAHTVPHKIAKKGSIRKTSLANNH